MQETRKQSLSGYCIRTGLVVCLTLIAYFFIMKAFGLHTELVLRGFNFLFLVGGILFALRHFSREMNGLEYFTGIRIGAQVTAFAVLPFAVFFGIYLKMDPSFMIYLRDNLELGPYLIPFTTVLALLIEGFVSGMLATYVLMPYFKKEPAEVEK